MVSEPQSNVMNVPQARRARRDLDANNFLDYELGQAVRRLPPFYTRLLAGSITTMLLAACAWAHFSKIDAVAVAPGELVPSTQVRPIRALDNGLVLDITVQEGARVKKGDPLIVKDRTLPNAEVQRLENEIEFIQGDIDRLETEWQGGELESDDRVQTELLGARQQDYLSRLSAARSEVSRQQALIQEANIKLNQLSENRINAELTLSNAAEREDTLSGLSDKGAVGRLDYLEAKDRLIQANDSVTSLDKEIAAQQQSIRQAQEAYSAAIDTVNQLTSQYRSNILSELNRRRETVTTLEGQLATAQVTQDRETITAPFDGVAYNVAATQGPVQSGEPLLSVLPEKESLVLEVKILNRDIGFIETEQRAKIKIATFPFQEFGIIEGEVISISPNATLDEELGPIFLAKVQLKQNSINAHGKNVTLVPGMTGTAEIVTRQRSVLQFLLEPIVRKFSEASSVR